MRTWRALAFAIFAAMLAAHPLAAQTIRVTSGEHDGYSRLVFRMPADTEWKLGRSDGGYVLSFGGAEISVATGRVFQMIPRTRLADIAADGPEVSLAVSCDCHATAKLFDPRNLIVDIKDGAAPDGSPFETALGGAVADKPAPAVAADLAQAREPASVAQDPDPPQNPKIVGVSSLDERIGRSAPPPTAATKPARDPNLRLSLPLEPRNSVLIPLMPGGIDPGQDQNSSTGFSALLPQEVNPRVANAQKQLLEQLGRAASQGLLVPADDAGQNAQHETASETEPAKHVAPEAAPAHAEAKETTAVLPMAPTDPKAHINFHAESAIDRAVPERSNRQPLTEQGEICVPNEDLDIAAWGDARPHWIQLSDARQHLYGEFDAPDLEILEALARLYLYVGFGAEAGILLDELEHETGKKEPILRAMSQIIDGEPTDPNNLFVGQLDCDTAAAMWAVLAVPALTRGADVNVTSVQRTLSALPIHLRRRLGPLLAARFLEIGDAVTADTLVNAVSRAAGDPGGALRLVEAQVELAAGRQGLAQRQLKAILSGDTAQAPEALVELLELRLASGKPVDRKDIGTAAALAFEHRDEKIGIRLKKLEMQSLASIGEFDTAFRALGLEIQRTGDAAEYGETVKALYGALSETATDENLTRFYFQYGKTLPQTPAADEVRRTLAARLLQAGLPGEAASAMAPVSARAEERDLLFLADVALQRDRPSEALRLLATVDAPQAAQLKTRALLTIGNRLGAASALSHIEDVDIRAEFAWRAGDLETAATIGSDSRMVLAARELSARDPLGSQDSDATIANAALNIPASVPAPTPANPDTALATDRPQAPNSGLLAQAKSILEGSRETRILLDQVLAPATVTNSKP